MVILDEGLNLSDKELRALLIMKSALSDFNCYRTCKDCCLEDDDGYCNINNISSELEKLFKAVIL